MTDNTMVQAFEDELAKCETAANKIRFREETYKSLNELANKKGMRKRMAVKDIEEELVEQNEKAKVEMDEATAKRIALLEMQLEFLKQGLNPSPESVDARIEIVKSRPLKVTEQMADGITHNTDAIKASGIEVISQEEQELIDGLIEQELVEAPEVEEKVAEKVEEVPAEAEAPEVEEKDAAEEEPLTVPFEEYNDAQETEEPLEEEIKKDYVEVDATDEEEKDEKAITGLTDEEIQSAKVDSEESKEEKEEKIDTLEEVELLFKEAEDVRQQASDLANERKQAEEKIAKEEEKRKEAQKLKETRDKALKEALAKYKENIKKEQEKVEAERKAKEEAERKAKEIQEQTKEFEERTKATEKALEMIMAKMDAKGEEKKEKKK